MAKIEQTSQTYGQLVISSALKFVSATAAQTSQVKQGTAESPATIVKVSLMAQPVLASSDPVAIAVDPNLPAVSQKFFVNPQDTLVKVISNIAQPSVLGCKVKATIAMAATTSRGSNATVAISSKRFQKQSNLDLQGSILTNLSTVSPNVTSLVTVVGSTVKTKAEIKRALTEAQKIDLSITLRSKISESIEFSTIKRPRFEVDFIYNFFVSEEEDVESQEDQTLDPLLKKRPVDTPRYSNLMWTVTQVTEPLTGTEEDVRKNKIIRAKTFATPKGRSSVQTQNVPFSIESSRKKVNPFIKDGLQRNIVDMHEPEKFFSALANDNEFPNSVSVTLNISEQKKIINKLPFLNISI